MKPLENRNRRSPAASPIWAAVAIAVVPLLDGCASNKGDDTPPAPTNRVGPQGGTVRSGGVLVEVPAGALDRDVDIVVTEVAGSGTARAFTFAPEGLEFMKPVTVTLPVVAGVTAPVVHWSRFRDLDTLETLTSRTVAGGVATDVMHFSRACSDYRCTAESPCICIEVFSHLACRICLVDGSFRQCGVINDPLCAEEICDDLRDNNGDGKTDCDDGPTCCGSAHCDHPLSPCVENCANGIDDDGDGKTDCDDTWCTMLPPCAELCDNGIDDDGDGNTDCDDPSCSNRPPCMGPRPDGGMCLATNAPCGAPSECCSGLCPNQDGPKFCVCGPPGGTCVENADCCGGDCQSGTCAAALCTPVGGGCAIGVQSGTPACCGGGDCRSGTCLAVGTSCGDEQVGCTSDAECCGGCAPAAFGANRMCSCNDLAASPMAMPVGWEASDGAAPPLETNGTPRPGLYRLVRKEGWRTAGQLGPALIPQTMRLDVTRWTSRIVGREGLDLGEALILRETQDLARADPGSGPPLMPPPPPGAVRTLTRVLTQTLGEPVPPYGTQMLCSDADIFGVFGNPLPSYGGAGYTASETEFVVVTQLQGGPGRIVRETYERIGD